MTGELVKAMRACPQPIVAAIDGVCAGAGAILAMASDLRLGTATAKIAFLFNRVGLAGCDMGACAMLPRIVGQGRAAELLYTGRVLARRGGRTLGLPQPARRARRPCSARRRRWRPNWPTGPTFANAMTKRMLEMEWAMSVETPSRPRPWRRRCACRPRIFRAPTTPSPPSRSRCSRATEMDARRRPLASAFLGDTLDWPFFEDRHRAFAGALPPGPTPPLPGLPHDDVDAACRARVKALAEAGFLKAVVPAAYGGLHPRPRRAHRSASPARSLAAPRRARRFRLRHAGARHRLDQHRRLGRR